LNPKNNKSWTPFTYVLNLNTQHTKNKNSEVPAESCSNEVVLVDKLQRDEGEGVGCGNIVPEDGDGGNSVNDGDIGDVHDALGSKSSSADAHLLLARTV